MYSKRDYQLALRKLGFKQDKMTATSGSHIRYHHSKYKNIIAGIDDHKDSKDMTMSIHMELVKAMTLVVWLECRCQDGTIDFKKAKEMLESVDKEMAREIISRLKKLDLKSNSFLLKLITKRLSVEIGKLNDTINNETILSYIED